MSYSWGHGPKSAENCHAEVRTTRLRASWASILPPSCSSRPDSISSHWVTESERSPRPYRQVPILKSHQRKLRFKEDTRLPPRPTSHVSTCHTSHVTRLYSEPSLLCMCRVPGMGTQIRFKHVAELFCHAHLSKHAQGRRVDV